MTSSTKTRKNKKPINHRNKTSKYKIIADRIQTISQTTIKKDFYKLKDLTCSDIVRSTGRTSLGNKIVDAFTFVERLHTKGNKNVSFYEFWENRNEYKKKAFIQNLLAFYKTRKIDEIRKYKYIYNLYFSSIAIFRPIMAMEIYCKIKAKRVLDFTMGWGGRLVGACALGLEAYYGVDLNTHLKDPYDHMIEFLESDPGHKTEIRVHFKDALEIDYTKMNYDCVFTSPPYYDIETYRGSEGKYKTKEEWNERFYKPLFWKTFICMKSGGSYCLNVPEYIYKDVCVPLFGKCALKIHLKKGERTPGKDKYKEYVYVWQKK
jgi:hypothetical protein